MSIVIRLRRAVRRRYLVNCLAVQRHGNVATHTKLLASRRLGRSAEGKTDCCCSEAGAKDRDLPPPGFRLIISSNTVVRAGFTMARLAKLERAARSCNGGCETSFRVGNAPWVGCRYIPEAAVIAFSRQRAQTRSATTLTRSA